MATPLHAALTALSAESREKIARDRLTLQAVRDAASAAALQGLNSATIPLGVTNLERTAAAKELMRTLKGFSFEWVEAVARDGVTGWELRIIWPIATAHS